ncbi:MAG: hypothetical protein ACOZB0_06430 [Pseudomonadota bacterium]
MRKFVGPALTLLLAAGVGVAIWLSFQGKQKEDRIASVIEVKGLSGSEKIPFLQDPNVLAQLEKQGIRLQAQKAGSREIALRPDLKDFDFAYPAGVPAATKLQKQLNLPQAFPTFFTPMAVASWKPVVAVLEANGVVEKRGNAWYIIDMMKLLAWMEERKRWRDLPGNTQYPVGKSILVSTTDVRTSNSAAMYLALLSYLANERNVVQNEAQATAVLSKVAPLFLRQGYQESSSAGPFEDYVSMGMGKAPLVMVYESQFIEYLAKTPANARNPDMVLLYPEPTVYTKHVLVPLNDKGRRVGEVLANDETLQRLAVEYGYRVSHPALFRETNKARGIEVPDSLIDVIDPPAYEVLERMISSIEHQMAQ